MDNVVSIVNAKPTELDFEIGVDGLSPKKMEARLCLKASDHCLVFDCKKSKGTTWSCKIPALPHLEKGAYPFFIEVVADGYHFPEIMKGTANVTGSFDVYAKKAEKIQPGKETKQPKKDEKGKTEKKTEKVTPPKKTKEATSYDFSKAAKALNNILSEDKKIEPKTSNVPEKKTDFSKAAAAAEKLLSENKKETGKTEPKSKTIKKKIVEDVKKPIPTVKKEKAPITPIGQKFDSIVKKILSETKGAETKAVQEAVRRVVPEGIKKKIVLAEKKEEKLEDVLTEKEKKELSEIDKAVKNILEDQHKEKVEEKKSSSVKFTKGKKVG